jgi:tRNA pseudouridine55 synthase
VSGDGLVVLDKPGGMTSHDVVARMRRLAHTRRVGHGGTLDPMATGVLVLGVERATRLLTYVSGSDKSYLATIRLGQATVTDDAEGEVVSRASAAAVTPDAIRSALRRFVGEVDQVPSSVSAIKVGGVRSYARVRKGELVELPSRRVSISRLGVCDIRPERDGDIDIVDVDIDVTCSSGTYIRAIARDLGAVVGVGGHLTSLRRTAVGGFTLAEAVTLAQLQQGPATTPPDGATSQDEAVPPDGATPPHETPLQAATLSLTAAARRLFARRDADEIEAKVLSHGGPLTAIGMTGPYAVFAPDGRVLAIVSERDGKARADVVLSPAVAGEEN